MSGRAAPEHWATDAQSCVRPASLVEDHKLSVLYPFLSSFSCAFASFLCYLILTFLYVLCLLNSVCFSIFKFVSFKKKLEIKDWDCYFYSCDPYLITFPVSRGGEYQCKKGFTVFIITCLDNVKCIETLFRILTRNVLTDLFFFFFGSL